MNKFMHPPVVDPTPHYTTRVAPTFKPDEVAKQTLSVEIEHLLRGQPNEFTGRAEHFYWTEKAVRLLHEALPIIRHTETLKGK